MKEFIFTWSIQNIAYSWHKTGEKIASPAFTTVLTKNSIWSLELIPRSSADDDFLALFLHRRVDNCPEQLSFNFELSCISFDKSLLSHLFPEADNYFSCNSGFGHPRFLRRHEVFVRRKSLYLPQDTLTVRCRIWKNLDGVGESEEIFGLTCLEIERILSVKNIKPRIDEETTVSIRSKRQDENLITVSLLHYKDAIKVVINPTRFQDEIGFSILKLSFVKKCDRRILCEHKSSYLGEIGKEIWHLNAGNYLNNDNEDSGENDIELISEFTYSTRQETETEKACPFSFGSSELVSKYMNSCISSNNLLDSRKITTDLWNLYVEGVFWDLELKTETSSFFVHKIVLCARSPVFLAMLSNDMKEKRKQCLEIEDITNNILKKFLFFLYTDIFEDHEWEAVIDLYYVADKYNVQRLKILCCSFLLENTDVHNVCELLLIADKHHDSDFKRRVENFILLNDKKIFSSPIWKHFVYEQPILSAMTMLLKYDEEKAKEKAPETYEENLSRSPEVLDDFKSIYQDKVFSDIIIKAKGATFHAHKTILCASSSTWRDYFTNDLRNKTSVSLEIEDLEDDTVSLLLQFLYSDSWEDIEWIAAFKLYYAANVYKIQRLKIKCSCFFLENLEISNAIDLLLLAHRHSDANLISVVQYFIIIHDEEIFGSNEWTEFSQANLLLANETMCLKYKNSCNIFN